MREKRVSLILGVEAHALARLRGSESIVGCYK